ncbi:glycosyltransferase family 4 protein [Anaerolineales bacterium HSG6]|nr:glycosyltransferase family 4 protein [Anaerolineales bacterium HSG6]MDM8531569.1 glycosyltransferase family 4 protein [Anaerolineales bacterium HSG25]
MRVIMLSGEYPPNMVGGLGKHVADLAPALGAEGVELHVITPIQQNRTTVTVEDGVTVHRVSTTVDEAADIHAETVAVNEQLAAYALEWSPTQPCIIHVHDWLGSFAGIALQRAWHMPLVATIHATEQGRWHGQIDQSQHLQRAINQADANLANQASRIIVCSHHMLNEIQSFFGVSAEKIDIIPNGIHSTKLLASTDELNTFRAKYGSSETVLIYTVARLVYEKGIQVLISTMSHVLPHYPQTQLLIAGKGPATAELQQLTHDLGITDHVTFLGFVSDTERDIFFKVADLAVIPSLYEPFGIVALEAMALSCPVVVSDTGGLAEVVEHQVSGLTVPPDNVSALSTAIMEILSDRPKTEQYINEAKERVKTVFNWQLIARQTIQLYERLN